MIKNSSYSKCKSSKKLKEIETDLYDIFCRWNFNCIQQNTFDFKTRIIGATDPFSYSGYIYNSEGVGIQNIPVKFYSKLKSSSTYTFESTINTDANGKYVISSTKDATVYDFQIEISIF